MAKKKPQVKFFGEKPENNLLKAVIPDSPTSQIMGSKVNLNHRSSALIETGIDIEVEKGYKVCFALIPELTNRGIIATNSPGNFTSGKIFANVLNVGREIVEIKTGDPFMTVWLEENFDFDWEKNEN